MDKYGQRLKQLGLNIAYYRKMRNLSQEGLEEKAHKQITYEPDRGTKYEQTALYNSDL